MRLGVEGDAAGHVGDVDGDVVDAGRGHGIGHASEPTTWRTTAATAGTAVAPDVGDGRHVDGGVVGGGRVGDHGEPEDLGTGLAGGDGLEGHGHADDVGAHGAQHADLGRGLELGARELGVDTGSGGQDGGRRRRRRARARARRRGA